MHPNIFKKKKKKKKRKCPVSSVQTSSGKQRKENASSRIAGGKSSQKGTAAHKPDRGISLRFRQDGSKDVPVVPNSKSKDTEVGPRGCA